MQPRSIKVRKGGAISLAALSLALFLAGCQSDQIDYTGSVPTDYRERHPIRLADKERTLQILVGSGRAGLTATQRAQVAAMGSDWRREGSGYIVVETPARAVNSRAARDSVREIRSLLQFAGVSQRAMKFRTYDQPYRGDLGPILVSYKRIVAEAGPCGQWPENLGPGVLGREPYPLKESYNAPYYNFGCATQRNLAAQVANPADLVQPRGEAPSYEPRRSVAIEKWRTGLSPSGAYPDYEKGKISDLGK